MVTGQLIAGGCLIALAAGHSFLGERRVLGPLFAAEWSTPGTPRPVLERILRMAWHLLSIALAGLGFIAFGLSKFAVIGWTALASAALIFVMARTHFAWPISTLAGFAALHANDSLTDGWLQIASITAIVAIIAAAALHVYWAAGGMWMLDAASPPTPPGAKRSFEPGPIATLAVAVALTCFATLIAMTTFDRGPGWLSWLVIIGVAVLTLRAIGDTKVAGFTKTIRDTRFAKADDRWFTPLIVFLAFGASASVLL